MNLSNGVQKSNANPSKEYKYAWITPKEYEICVILDTGLA